MPLDMHTMSTVNVTVTAMLGIVLVFTRARERECPFVGWWLGALDSSWGRDPGSRLVHPRAGDLLAIGVAEVTSSLAIQ
jgi:hypothetical protein